MDKGIFIMIVGPSAVGKTDIVGDLLEHIPQSCRLITSTTRDARPKEIDGKDYHFLSRDDFRARVAQGEFLEWVEYSGNLYGSSQKVLDELLARHVIVLGILNVRGARAVKAILPDAVTVFVRPGDLKDLEQRHLRRHGARPQEIAKRMQAAWREIECADEFDHQVTNIDGQFQDTVEEIMAIVFPYQFWHPGKPPRPKAEE